MATIAAVIRWADNTDQLKRNLKEGLNQIEAVRASADKMVQSLSGDRLIQAAHRSVAAITQIGGATKLTAQEAQRNLGLIDKAMEKMALTGKTIPDDMKRMRDELEKVSGAGNGLMQTVGRLTAAFVAMVAVAVVKWFQDGIREGLRYGDMLVGLRAKTDLSIRDLQILEDIGIDANVSVETLARGVQMLQERLANGSAHKGIREIGLSIDALRAMSPGEMFAAIGAEIAKIEDPIRRADAASKIFGRSWREIIPALRVDMGEAAKLATIVGDAQVEAADRAIDRWNKFWNDQKRGWTAWAGDVILNWEKVSRKKAELDAFGALPALPAAPAPRIALPNIVNDVDPERIEAISRAQIDAIDARTAATRRAAEEQARWNARVREFSGPAKGFEFELALLKFQLSQVADATLLADQRAIGYLGTLKQFTDAQIPELPSRQIGDGVGRGPAALPTQTFDASISRFGAMKEALSAFKAEWLDFDKVVGNVAKGFLQHIGSMLSGGLMGLVGKGIEALWGGLKKLFKIGTEESTKVSPLRDEFFKLQGGLERLNPLVQQLTGNLDLVKAIFNAKTVEQYNKAVGDLFALLDLQKTAFADLEAAAQRYGFTLEELGPALQRQKLDEQAQQIFKDWQLLNSAGIDTATVATRMASTINTYVQNAVKMGIEVPEAMRPMLQQMVDLGLLTDAAGNKITSLEDAGVSFAMTMSEGFKSLIEEVKKLTDLIARSLGRAIENIPDPEVVIHAKYDIPELPNLPKGYAPQEMPWDGPAPYTPEWYNRIPDDFRAARGGLVTEQGIQRFAQGGKVLNFVPRGIDTVPAMLAVGEGVVNRSGMGVLGERGLMELNRGSLPSGSVSREWQPPTSTTVIRIEKGAIQAGMIVTDQDLDQMVAAATMKGLEQGGRPLEQFDRHVVQAVKGRRVA